MERKTHTHFHNTLTRWTAQIIKVIATHGRRSSHLSLLQMKPDPVTLTDSPERKLAMEGTRSREHLSTYQDLHKITQTHFASCFLKNKIDTKLN